jgi:hypothetical protein
VDTDRPLRLLQLFRIGGVFDFRNETLVKWFATEYVGGPQCIGHPMVDGWFADDVYGLGSPGSPDRAPVVKESGLSPDQVAAWNRGQQKAVVGAQTLAVNKLGSFNWQNFQPSKTPTPPSSSSSSVSFSLLHLRNMPPKPCVWVTRCQRTSTCPHAASFNSMLSSFVSTHPHTDPL